MNLLIGICKLVNCENPGGERREGFAKWRFGSAPAFTAFTASDGPLNRLQSRALFSLSLIFTTVLFHSAPAFTAFTASDVLPDSLFSLSLFLLPESCLEPYFHSAYSQSIWQTISNQQPNKWLHPLISCVFGQRQLWINLAHSHESWTDSEKQVYYSSLLCRLFGRRGLGLTQLLQWYLRPGFNGSPLDTPHFHWRLSLSQAKW